MYFYRMDYNQKAVSGWGPLSSSHSHYVSSDVRATGDKLDIRDFLL